MDRDWTIVDIDGWLDGNEYPAGLSNEEGGDATAASSSSAEGRKDE